MTALRHLLRLLVASVAAALIAPVAPPLKAQGFSEIVRVADAAVGRVLTFRGEDFLGSGSGFIFARADGAALFLTNHHVIEDADGFVVGFLVDATPRIYAARLRGHNRAVDLAILELVPDEGAFHRHTPLAIATGRQAKGQPVAALGYPGLSDTLTTNGIRNPSFFETTLTTGTISRVAEGQFSADGSLEIVQHTAPINPGNSGGPLLDACGAVVGVNTSGPVMRDGARSVPSGTFWSSSNRTITQFLDAANVPYARRTGPCRGATGGAAGQVEVPGGGSGGDRAEQSAPPDAGARRLYVLATLVGVTAIFAGGFLYMKTRGAAAPAARLDRTDPVAPAPSPIMTLRIGGLEAPLTQKALERGVTIGRGTDCDISADMRALSRRHARLSISDRKLMIEDLASSNGTRVEGRPLEPGVKQQINSRSNIALADIPLSIGRP